MINSESLMQQLLQTFYAEAAEHLQNLNLAVLALELRPDETARRKHVQEAFRSAHSLKGAARTVGLDSIENTAHAMESALQHARDTDSHLDGTICEALYDALDTIGALLENKNVDVQPIVNRLGIPTGDTLVPDTTSSHKQVLDAGPSVLASLENLPPALSVPQTHEVPVDTNSKSTNLTTEESIRVSVSKLDDLMAQVGELLVSRINAEQRISDLRLLRQRSAAWSKSMRELHALVPMCDGHIRHQLNEILINCDDQLEQLLGGLTAFDQKLKQDTVRLGLISSRLQDNARRVRMVPFETLVPLLQRTVRDAAHTEQKNVVFNVVGGWVELDKKVLESLKDPFIHMLRNAVGHGIEDAAIRSERGKSLEGHVTLTLQQRGSEVRISIQDDGGGFDLAALHRAGGNPGTYEANNVENEQAIIKSAFLPGVTTSQGVTTLSGRGVGLDVVRERVEELQGHIDVESLVGQGATIHIVVPSSLTISRGLLVQVGFEQYVLPLLSIVKIFVPQEFFSVSGRSMVNIDGLTVPVADLADILGRQSDRTPLKSSFAIMLAVAEQRLVLLVDDVITELELTIKPLSFPLRRVHNIAGAALMGDGKPVVVLNAAELIRVARKHAQQPRLASPDNAVQLKSSARILVVDDSITTRTLEKSILETAGYEVVTATDGLQAVERLANQHIDLVVSDVEMPNMDGIKLTSTLRQHHLYAELPIILVTSLESKEDRERGMVAGANAYIVKRGFDQGELLKIVEQLVFVEDG